MTDSRIRTVGIGVTLAVHLGVLGVVWAMNARDQEHAEKRAREDKPQLVHIEAGLAIREKRKAGRESKQPQKQATTKKQRDTVKLAANPDKVPTKPAETEDVNDAYEAARRRAQQAAAANQDEVETEGGSTEPTTNGPPGTDDEDQAGRPDGSDRGTLMDPKGHAYLGDLVGRMVQNFHPPTMVTGQRETWGCVRVNARGEIVDYMLDPEHKSGDARFDGAVEKSLILSKQLEGEDVPDELRGQLLGKFVCATFKND